MYIVTLRWADAIVYDNEKDEIIIIEAKLRADSGAIGQLKLYEKLFRSTPEFEFFKDKPIRKVFLTPQADLALAELTSAENIDYVVWPEPKGFTAEE